MLLVIIGALAFVGYSVEGNERWAMLIGIGLFGSLSAYSLVSLIDWIHATEGTADYLSLDHVNGEVVLPRLGVSFEASAVKRIIETQATDSFSRLALVIENVRPTSPEQSWAYAYVFSPYGKNNKIVTQLAALLNVDVERIVESD